jgi:hypothetical protein
MHATKMGNHAIELANMRPLRFLAKTRALLKAMHEMRFARQLLALVVFGTLIVFHFEAAGADERPIASASIQNGKIRVEILSLKRIEGDLVTLRWQLVNDDNKDFSMTTSNERLIDLVARREYSAGMGGRCSAEPGRRSGTCWATFQAPPPNTKSMAVKFYEGFEMITSVPVTD